MCVTPRGKLYSPLKQSFYLCGEDFDQTRTGAAKAAGEIAFQEASVVSTLSLGAVLFVTLALLI